MKLSKHQHTEFIAGATTFFTMAYIVVVNPGILATEGTHIPFSGALTATVLLCFTMTLFMGWYAKLPFAVAPGMGINAFFTYNLILGKNIPWPTALGMTFWAGILFVLISTTPFREKIATSIPHHLRVAAASGIGFFLTFIGLKNAGIIEAHPVTFVKLAHFTEGSLLAILALGVSVFLLYRKNAFAFLAGIFLVTVIALVRGKVQMPEHFFAPPDFQLLFQLDIWGSLKLALVPAIVSMMLTDLFDSLSTFIGVSHASGLVDREGNPKNLKQGLIVDAFATLGAGLFGTSAGTAYIESAAGVEVGGRTGLTAITTALLFLPCFFLAPLCAMVPGYATAPVLIIVGSLMFRSISFLPLQKMEELIPAYLTMVLIPLTFSITQGILMGIIAHVVLFLIVGRAKELTGSIYAMAGLASVLLLLEQL